MEGEKRSFSTMLSRFAIAKNDAVPVVLQWLENHFEQCSDASIPKQDVYREYCDFCHRHRIEPTSASAFGRLVRLVFPGTTSRRLGARGANVTVYNHFRRRESVPMAALVSSQKPPPSTSRSSELPVDVDHTRLRGGGKKADGRTMNGIDPLYHGGDAGTALLKPEPECEGPRPSANETGSQDLILNQGFVQQQHMETCTTGSSLVDYYDFAGDSGSNFLVKMLKSEENGAELYDSLYRLLYGSGRLINELPPPDRKVGELPPNNTPDSGQPSQKMRQDGTSSNQEEKEQKPSLWNTDTHLHLMKLWETYRDCYTHDLWLLNPLHPGALEDDNIRYIMCTDEGAEERSPLSLSIYWILYSGALMSKHTDRAKEFYGKAREHLGHIFDQSDSTISLVLLPMAYHARFWAATEEDGVAKCAYYLTLAMEICKRVGCLGSSVYISCLQMYAWFCMTDYKSATYEEKLQEVKKISHYPALPGFLQATAIPRNAKTHVRIPISHLKMVEKMFGVVGSIMKGIFIFKSTSNPSSEQLPSQPPSSPSSPSPFSTKNPSHKRKRSEEPRVLSDAKIRHDQTPTKHIRTQIPPSNASGEIHRIGSPFSPNTTLQPLLLPLNTMEQDLEAMMKSDDPLPPNIYMMFKLWVLGERAECYWCMGQPQEALTVALSFLEVSKRSTKNLISHYVSIQPILEMVLDIFLSICRFDYFRELVDAILEPLDQNIPHVARSKTRYLSALFAASPFFASSLDVDASPPSSRPYLTLPESKDENIRQ